MRKLSLLISETVTNHLTPIENIMSNVKNMFAVFGLVCTTDGQKLIIKSSKFTTQQSVWAILYDFETVRNTSLCQYITQQGLDKVEIVLGSDGEWYAICYATDIESPDNYIEQDYKIKESFNTNLYSYFMEDEDELLGNVTTETLVIYTFRQIMEDTTLSIVQKADKLDILLRKNIKLGDKWRMRAVKDEKGNNFIVLRQTYDERRPCNQTVSVTASRVAFIDTDERGIFLYNAETKDYWNKEQKEMIDKVFKLLKCSKTSDIYSYSLGEVEEINKPNNQQTQSANTQNTL